MKLKVQINGHRQWKLFREMNTTLENLVTQTFELNKTMNNIAKSLRVISLNKLLK